MEKTLVKIYRNKAVFLEKPNRFVIENIPLETAKILDFYKKLPANDF